MLKEFTCRICGQFCHHRQGLKQHKKAIHKNDEKTFSVANSVILKVANFQSNVAKKIAITLESKVAKKIATLESKVAKYSPLYLKSNTKP